MATIQTKFEIEGIGPHERKLALNEGLKSNAVAIFARNGSGKSFIGRVFRLVARVGWLIAHGKSSGEMVLQKNEAYQLLTVGRNSGRMSFSQQCDNEAPTSFTIDVGVHGDGSEKIMFNGSHDYIFRVFNLQYVEENIKRREYVLAGLANQEWVIGETNIQIDNLQSELRTLDGRIAELQEKFASTGREWAYRLNSQYKVMKNTGVFKQLFAEDNFSIMPNIDLSGVREFSVVAEKLSVLASVPDDLPDVTYIGELQGPKTLLDDISEFLGTVVPRSQIVGAGAEEIKNNREFFEHGLRLATVDGHRCPFCRQDMTAAAIQLLEQYKVYLDGAEVKAAKKAEILKAEVVAYFGAIDAEVKQLQSQRSQLLEVGRYFDSVSQLLTNIPSAQAPDPSMRNQLISLIDTKSREPSAQMMLPDGLRASIVCAVDEIERVRKECDERARVVNVKKISTSKDRLALRIELVKAAFLELKKSLRDDIANCAALLEESGRKKDVLNHLLEGNREPKRKLVFDLAVKLLKELFGGKYSLREEDFVLQFKGVVDPNRPISAVLSDGERSAISFCYFLAETHLFVDKKDDYQKLFFIFDDPISSMDAQFVYAITNLLKRINQIFPGMVNKPKRYWIFTHSMNFYSMLMRNNVCKDGFVLHDGEFKKIPEAMLLPFESHLADVVRVAEGQVAPAHTTGNSVRHVLEVFSKFEYPLKNIDQYVSEEFDLASNPSLLTFMNDYSHGAFQSDLGSIGPMMISICRTVKEHVIRRYPGQIAAIQRDYASSSSVPRCTTGPQHVTQDAVAGANN